MKGILATLATLSMFVSLAVSQDFFPLPPEKAMEPAVSYHKLSIDDILSNPVDEDLVKLSGEIVRKLKCSTYLFRDETGEIRIEIRNEDIPEKGLIFKTPILIKGEVSREPDRPVRIEADKVRYNF